MGMSWTRDQQEVINKRNSNILVAAAAGSGKTAVLVERIITRLTKDEHPLNVDELLIVTFTEAAAAEMKERILVAIEKALEENPYDAHLQKQATLIHSAFITTIHSFCLSVIRSHFHTIDLDPVFRIGEEGELKLLKQDTMNQLLEKEYEKGTEEFKYLIECLAPGKSDKKIEELVLNIYGFSRSNPQPSKWLESCVSKYEIPDINALEKSSIGQYMIKVIENGLVELIERTELALQICREDGGPHHYVDALQCDMVSFEHMLKELLRAKEESVNQLEMIYQLLKAHSWEPLSRKRPKDIDGDRKQVVQEIRDKNKKNFEGWKTKYFYLHPELQLKDIQNNKNLIRELIRLVQAFAILYEKEKQARGMIDFNDMEQYALKILMNEEEGSIIPSEVAREYQEKFAEVMIDEYQDSNLVQEALLTSVSQVSRGNYNIFMVGDVKQSIYRFRLSRPELFVEKFNTYRNDDSQKCRIDLNKNFRSRVEVLNSTNYVFYRIMKSSLGGISYDEKSALYCGAQFPEYEENAYKPDNTTELILLDTKEINEAEEGAKELEARMVARRIKELVGNHLVFDKNLNGYRPARYSDIVLLSRSLSGWTSVFSKKLGEEGVPVITENKEGYFSTLEVSLLLEYLRILDNPQQDIPLASILRSVFGNITDRELAMIKGRFRTYTFVDAVYAYANVKSDASEDMIEIEGIDLALQMKLQKCLQTIDEFRVKTTYMGIHELLWEILESTRYREYVYALPGGEQRRANVDMLLEKATAFEGTSYKGIFNFIRYIEKLQKYQVEYGEANIVDEQEDAVRFMSIHKSKGLEFPIVFVIGMGKLFNKKEQAETMVMHLDEGIAMDTISAKKRTKCKSIIKQVIKKRMDDESLGEELRVLYVAMTRAKEKLIMTGIGGDLEKKLEQLRMKIEVVNQEPNYTELISARSYLDWILPNVYLQPESGIMVCGVNMNQLVACELEEEIQGEWNRCALSFVVPQEVYNQDFKEKLEAQFNFRYEYEQERDFKLKMSVSEIKKRTYMLEHPDEIETQEEYFVPSVPNFIRANTQEEQTKKKAGAFRGTAYHKFLELWDFTKDYQTKELIPLLEAYVSQKKMTQEMRDCIEPEVIEIFMDTLTAKRMKRAARAGTLFEEQPFVLGVKAEQVYGVKSDATILVQGIIDVYFEEDEEIVVLDYKTDQVKSVEELRNKYREQLDYYAQALETMTGKHVKEKIIYSLTLQEELYL